MRLREKRTISGELGMQSMTDIIFILLMFFMMVSTLVHPSALTLKLPGRSKSVATSTSKLNDVAVTESGNYLLNGKPISLTELKTVLGNIKPEKDGKAKISISPTGKAPVEAVVAIMDLAVQMGIDGILHADL